MPKTLFLSCAIATTMTLASPLVPASGLAERIAVSAAKADNGAARRTARRTARRVSRRQAQYHNVLPAGCVKVILRGATYFQCGAVYYQPVVHQGASVFVIVTP